MSFVMFPADEPGAPALIAMGVGTNGLSPDDGVLGRPGHARKCAGIAAWLNTRAPSSAWAKRDPVRIDLGLPHSIQSSLSAWAGACEKYGKVLYATFAPPRERTEEGDKIVRDAITAFVDLFFDERRITPLKTSTGADVTRPQDDAMRIRKAWMSCLMPAVSQANVYSLLKSRHFVVIEGPPGTGKTRMASQLLEQNFGGHGKVIQFHPGTTYESFIGGLAPQEGGQMGFVFKPVPGQLMDAVQTAAKDDRPYLLVIDEINRADLAKVLGEAIYLFEPGQDRAISLAHPFPGLSKDGRFRLPKNLYVLGTMNSADRSIAILDVAVRRRFAFKALWPQLSVLETDGQSCEQLQRAFQDIVSIFIEYASDESLPLMPGHSYFLGKEDVAAARLNTELKPKSTWRRDM
jgi:5-methylcytosine-specific restriction protein B